MHIGHAFCLIANARLLNQDSDPIWMQVVLFNALSSEPEDDACIRLTGVSGGLQVSCLSYECCLPMHGCNFLQCSEVINGDFNPFPIGLAAPLEIDIGLKSALALVGSTSCNSNGTEASLAPQIFFFFFGLVIIGVGVMTSSLEGSSFQVGNGDAGDGGLPYRLGPVTLHIHST